LGISVPPTPPVASSHTAYRPGSLPRSTDAFFSSSPVFCAGGLNFPARTSSIVAPSFGEFGAGTRPYYLATAFEPGLKYSESQVNDTVRAWHPDVAALRRFLVEEGFMARQDGVYWRCGGWV